MPRRLLGAGSLLVACVIGGSICWGGAEEISRYGQPVQITAYDVTVAPDFEANVCHVDAVCRLRNFGTAPAQTASAFMLGPEATGTEVKDLEFRVPTAAGGWENVPFATTELPFASWLDEKLKVYQVSLPQPLQPQAETALRATYTLSTTDAARSDIMPPLPADRRELVLLVDHAWLPTVPAGAAYAFTRYGRDKYDIRYKPTWTVRVKAPAGYRAVAVSGEAVGENVWRSRVPGDLMVFIGRYQLTTVEDSGIAVDVYSPPSARDDLTAIAHEIAEYYRIYTDAFGPLPGTRFNALFTAHPDFAGHAGYLGFAMDQAIRGGPSSLAHELAHSWWGLSVSAYGVGTKFLEESLAEWSTRWAEKKLHGGALPTLDPPDRWRQFRLLQESFGPGREFGGNRRWPRTGTPAIIDLDAYGQVGDRDMAYSQGPGLLTQIMNTVGEAAFLKALRTYATMHQDGWCTLDDFVAALKDSTGRDFGPFFHERTVATGVDTRLHSFYVASGMRSYRKGAGWETEVTVLNKGTHETVCPIALRTSGGTVERTMQVPPGAVRTVRFATDAQVKLLVIDPRWQALPVVGEKAWRGINLPSDDPWELARQMTPESMGGENWAWYLHALAFGRAGQWQACADTFTQFETRARAFVPNYTFNDMAAYPYLRGVALLHLGKVDQAAEEFPYAIDDLLDGLAGLGARGYPGSEWPALFSFESAGIIADTRDLVSANHLLELLTGQDFGFDPQAGKEANALAVARWQAWWKEHRSSYRVPAKLRQYPDLLVISGA